MWLGWWMWCGAVVMHDACMKYEVLLLLYYGKNFFPLLI
jgi:hypothetical protein